MSWNDTFKEIRETALDEYLIRTQNQQQEIPSAEWTYVNDYTNLITDTL